MSHETDNKQTQDQARKEIPRQASDDVKPDPNVEAPAYTYLTEGYDPDSLKKKRN